MAKLSYKRSGVNIDTANAAKNRMKKILDGNNRRVLNKVGAFATLFDGVFKEYKHPVLVFKTEEPGTKQKLALQHGSVDTICRDLVGHLINDAVMMGAKPLSVQDCIVCGKFEKATVLNLVSGLSRACKENGCVLTGGETSEQPGVIDAGTYILTASIVAVVEKENIIDGSKIRPGDIVLALASSGVHTNGLSLIRKLLASSPKIAREKVNGKNFIKAVLTPHRCYYNSLKDLFGNTGLVGLAHITGGGIRENLDRILPVHTDAHIDLGAIKILPIFKLLRKYGKVDDADMLRTFNLGVGVTAVVRKPFVPTMILHMKKHGIDAYPIGVVKKGAREVALNGVLNW